MSKEHKVFYIPPQSPKRGQLVELEGIQNLKVLVENTEASTHLEVNSIFHVVIYS
jgi:hypothetical protein